MRQNFVGVDHHGTSSDWLEFVVLVEGSPLLPLFLSHQEGVQDNYHHRYVLPPSHVSGGRAGKDEAAVSCLESCVSQ